MKWFLTILCALTLSFSAYGRLEVINEVPEGHAQLLWQNTIILGAFDIENVYDKTEREERFEYVARSRGFTFTIQLTPTGDSNPKLLKINIPNGCRIRMMDTYILCIGGPLIKNSELEWSIQEFDTDTITHTTITFKQDPTSN